MNIMNGTDTGQSKHIYIFLKINHLKITEYEGAVSCAWAVMKQTAVEQAERSNGPSGTRSHPLWPRLWRGACGVVAVPQDTATSSSDSPRLFERSASGAKSSSAAHPASATTQVAPQHAAGSRTVGTCSWPTVLWPALRQEQEGRSAAGPRPGRQAEHRHAVCQRALRHPSKCNRLAAVTRIYLKSELLEPD